MFLFPSPFACHQNVSVRGTSREMLVFGVSVATGPANDAFRSAVPHPPLNTKAPPWDGSSNTFMKPIQVALGSTPTVTAARTFAAAPISNAALRQYFRLERVVFIQSSFGVLLVIRRSNRILGRVRINGLAS